ncbi:hypothetical protein [Leptolyngbya sp. FACHB-1624]|uniref:hypothetical protein n=1 Tax=Leptolyngbya TaxID=47251 RepID=UPI0016839985|nr:hypothetical protein [Leptolyngbya sp. FACHB-1624]
MISTNQASLQKILTRASLLKTSIESSLSRPTCNSPYTALAKTSISKQAAKHLALIQVQVLVAVVRPRVAMMSSMLTSPSRSKFSS